MVGKVLKIGEQETTTHLSLSVTTTEGALKIELNHPALAPHERLTDLAVVPREKPHTGAAAREQPRDSPVIAR